MADLVLITGCNGFIASWVAKYALDAGYKVRGTVRDPTNEKKTKFLRELSGADKRLELVTLDLDKSDQEVYDKAAHGCSFIIHTASPVPIAEPKDENEVIKPAVSGTLMVLRAALKNDTVKRVVITSSVAAVYKAKAKPEGAVFVESDWADAYSKISAYAKSKTLAERAAWDFVKENSPSWTMCTMNPSLTIGPSISTERTSSLELGIRLVNGSLPMLPHVSFATVDVRDVAMAHIKALQVPAEAMNGRRFLLSYKTCWFKDFSGMINDSFGLMGYKATTREAPYFLMWVLSFFDEAIAFILPLINEFILFDNSPSREALGIEYRPIEETMRDYCHSLIYLGYAKKLPGYTPPSSSWTPASS